VLGEQLSQRAEGLVVRWLAATAVKARAGEDDSAERSAKDDRVLSRAAQPAATGRTAAVPINIGSRLGCDELLLKALLQGFALADREAKGFEPLFSRRRISLSVNTVPSSPMIRSWRCTAAGMLPEIAGSTVAKLPVFTRSSYQPPTVSGAPAAQEGSCAAAAICRWFAHCGAGAAAGGMSGTMAVNGGT
jgi:hypothetical protein